MPETAPVTFREVVLTSLLLHALIFILLLLFPGLFTWHPASVARPSPDDTIPLAFLQKAPPEEPAVSLGDAGKALKSDPRPAAAPPPRNTDPYSRGNTPNRFMAPP